MKDKTMDLTKRTWRLLFIAWVAILSTQIITFSYGMIVPSLMQDFSLDYHQIGLIGSSAGFTAFFSTLPITLFATKFNPKYAFPFILVGAGLGTLVFGLASGTTALYAGKIIAAFFVNAITCTLAVVKSRQVPLESMTKVNGIENFMGPIGQVIGTLAISSIILAVNGWRNVYNIIATILILSAFLWFFNYREKEGFDSEEVKKEGIVETLKVAIKQKTFWLFALGWPGTTLIWIGMFFFWPSYVHKFKGFSLVQAGMILSLIPIFSGIASLLAAPISKLVGRDKPIIVGCGLALPLCYYAMLQSSNIVVLGVAAAVSGFLAYLFVPLAFTTMFKLGLPHKVVSVGISMILTGVALGSAAGSSIISYLIKSFDGDIYKALAIACLSPLLFAALSFFAPERGHKWLEDYKKAMAQKQAESK